eukprot:406731-Hanusia_phi.AAC.1
MPPNARTHGTLTSMSLPSPLLRAPLTLTVCCSVRDHHRRNSELLQEMTAHLNKLLESNLHQRKVNEYRAQ